MIKALILSIQFLTRIPINIDIDFNGENLKKSTFFYPIVGVILGALSFLVFYIFSYVNRDLASLAAVISMIAFTGGLHLDGLADSADGFFSNKDKEKTMEIMKDSRIGAFGVISLVFIILSKYIVVSNIDKYLFIVLIFSMANSRLVTLFQIAFKKNARPGGLGDLIHKSKPRNYIVFTSIIYIFILALINPKFLIPLIFSVIVGEFISL